MKKRLFIILAIIVVSVIVFGIINYYSFTDNQLAKEEYLQNTDNKNDNIDGEYIINENDIIASFIASASSKINISDNSVINEEADFIILGTIDSIDGGINYNPTKKVYTIPQTIGTLTVNKVIKGKLNENKLSFIRRGGVVSVEEYEKSLFDSEKTKMTWLNNISAKDKKTKYVSEDFEDDIKLEKNKEYLMYLQYAPDYDRYVILFFQYGLREIKNDASLKQNYASENNTYENIENIKVKNNVTGEWEDLNSVIQPNVTK